MREQGQGLLEKDGIPLTIGGGSIVGFTLADVAETAQQIGVILGAVLVGVTLAHRIYVFYKDTQK